MTRLFITGGTGYLGSVLVNRALARGWQVAASYFRQCPPFASDALWIPMDVCDEMEVQEVFTAFDPTVVIHTAYCQEGPYLWDITAQGSQHVATAAADCSASLIHLSSDVIFDGESNRPYTETDIPTPITPYGCAKVDAERFVSMTLPSATIVRTSLIYGFVPIDRHTRFILDIADGNHHAALFADEYRCPIFVNDLASALLELVEQPAPGILHIAGADTLSRHQFGQLLAEAHGRDPSRLIARSSAESPTPRPRNCALACSRAQTLLRTPLRGVREVLRTKPIAAAPE